MTASELETVLCLQAVAYATQGDYRFIWYAYCVQQLVNACWHGETQGRLQARLDNATTSPHI